MHRFTRVSLPVAHLCLLLGGVGLSGSASAAIVPMAGAAQQPTQSTCFSNGWGRVTNECSAVRQWCVASYTHSSGGKTVLVNGYRPNGGTFACHATAVSSTGTAVSGTGARSLTTVDTNATYTLGTVSVPSYGALYVCCDLSKGARINTINY